MGACVASWEGLTNSILASNPLLTYFSVKLTLHAHTMGDFPPRPPTNRRLVPLYLHTGLVFGMLRPDKMLLVRQATGAITFLVEQHLLGRMETKRRKRAKRKKRGSKAVT